MPGNVRNRARESRCSQPRISCAWWSWSGYAATGAPDEGILPVTADVSTRMDASLRRDRLQVVNGGSQLLRQSSRLISAVGTRAPAEENLSDHGVVGRRQDRFHHLKADRGSRAPRRRSPPRLPQCAESHRRTSVVDRKPVSVPFEAARFCTGGVTWDLRISNRSVQNYPFPLHSAKLHTLRRAQRAWRVKSSRVALFAAW